MKKDYLGYVSLLNTLVLFSTYEVVSKTITGRISPFQVNFIRFLTGGAVLLALLIVRKNLSIKLKDLAFVSILGITNVVFSMSLLQISLYLPDAKASVAAVIFSSNPVFVTVISSFMDKEEINTQKVIGLLSAIAGITVIFLEHLEFSISTILSPLLALCSAIFFAIYTVMGRKTAVRIGSLKMNAYSFIAGSIALLPLLAFYGTSPFAFDYTCLPQMIYLSVLVSGLAYFTYFIGLSKLGASKGSLVFFLKPVLASIFAVVFLNEKATLNLLAGTLLVILGIFIILHNSKNKNAA